MSEANSTTDLLMFGDLLEYLRQHGFRLGVDHYLRLQQLLDRVGMAPSPGRLRTLLCPIFATSRAQQEQFYKAFDSYFDIRHTVEEEPAGPLQPLHEASQAPAAADTRTHSGARRRIWLYVAGVAAAAAIAFAIFLILKPASETRQAQAGPSPDVAATAEPAAVEGQTTATQVAAAPTPTPTPAQGFYERNRTFINLTIILSPLLLFLLLEWYRFARRKLLLQRQQARRPPFVWPIQVSRPEGSLYDSEQFLNAARLMRRRQVDEFRRLDVEATVSATVARLGFPDFRYKSDSRVPEYLLLIDRASFRDHQARLFDELALALEREGVFVARYFFDGDPRVCRDRAGALALQLSELQNRYGGHRLIIFGEGEKLLDQLTGRMEGWTIVFNHWQDRALLTPEPVERWGLREVALAQSFIVLPATLQGLLALVDYFETTLPEDLRSWLRGGAAEAAGALNLQAEPEETVRRLRQLLGEEAFQWLCACAVYTELQWDLTLYLGSLPSMPPGLVTEANLLKLIRLPWFRHGSIPDELRWPLINALTPERQQAARAAIIELLEKDPAPPETVANDQYQLNLFAQRWLHSRTRKRLRELLELMKRLPRSQVVRDLTLVRFLESARTSPLDILLPAGLRRSFYRGGVPAFGLKTGSRLLVALLFMGLAWVGIKAITPSRQEVVDNQQTARSAEAEAQPAEPQADSSPAQADAQPATSEAAGQSGDAAPSPQAVAADQGPRAATGTPVETAPTPAAAESPGSEARTATKLPGPVLSSGASQPERSVTSIPGIGDSTARAPVMDNDKEPPPPMTQASPPSAQATPGPKPNTINSVGVLNSRAKSLPKPDYPREAAEAAAAGPVQVQVVLDENGKVVSARATSGHPTLRGAAEEAAYRARFAPQLVDGKPARVQGYINYNFVLQRRPEGDDMGPQQQRPNPPGRGGGRRPGE